MTDQPIEPMTDEVIAWWKERVTTNLWDRDVLSLMARLDAEIARANAAEAEAALWRIRAMAAVSKLPDDMRLGELQAAVAELEKIKAERDAALARSLPAPVKMETVEQVRSWPDGNYLIRLKGMDTWTARLVRGGRTPWNIGDDAVSDRTMVGAWIAPLPDIPIPTSEEG